MVREGWYTGMIECGVLALTITTADWRRGGGREVLIVHWNIYNLGGEAAPKKCGVVLEKCIQVHLHRWWLIIYCNFTSCWFWCYTGGKNFVALWDGIRKKLVHQGEELPATSLERLEMFVWLADAMINNRIICELFWLTSMAIWASQTASVSETMQHPFSLSQWTPDFAHQMLIAVWELLSWL